MDKENKTSKVLIIILILVIVIVAFLIIRDKKNEKDKSINSNTSNIVSDNNYSNIDSNITSNEENSNELSNSNIQSNSNELSNNNSQINSNSNNNSNSNKSNSNSNKPSTSNSNSNKPSTSNSNSNKPSTSNSNSNKPATSNSNSNPNTKQITSITIPSYYQDMNLSYKDTFNIKDIVKLEPKFEDDELKSWLNKLTYSSSDSNVLKVSTTGVVTAYWPGSATITVKTPNGLSATLRLSVKYPNPYKVELYNVNSGTTINNQNYWIELITLNDNGCLATSSCTKTISLVVKIGKYNASTGTVTNAKNVALYTNGNKVSVPGTDDYISATIVGNAIQFMYYDM